MLSRCFAALALVAAASSCTPDVPSLVPAAPPPGPKVPIGFRTIEAKDPITHAPLPMVFYYPSTGAVGEPTTVGAYKIDAAKDATIAAGKRAFVVVSHGHMGSMWGHHDLCEALARHGYVVGAVEHIGDSFRDQSAFRTDRMLLGRAYQASAVIDAALADPALAAHVDPTRIGAAGFSAGGYTALLLVGAHPDFDRLAGYCERHPKDDDFCGHGDVKRTIDAPAPTADPRVRAAFVMAPLGVFFGPHAFDDVKAPVFLYWATADHVLLPEENAEAVERGARTLVTARRIDGAGHFVFMPPCSPALMESAPPALCHDPPFIDRAALHAKLAEDANGFFDQSLGGAKP